MQENINQVKPNKIVQQVLKLNEDGLFEKAIEFAEKFYKNNTLDSAENIVTNIHLCNDLAMFYSQKNDPKTAIEYSKRGIDLAEKYEYFKIIARQYMRLAIIYSNFYIIDKAIELLDEALDKANKYKQTATIPLILSNKASLLFLEGKADDAIVIFEQQLEAKELLSKKNQLYLYNELGKCYVEKEKFDKAIECINLTLDFELQENLKYRYILNLALCQLKLGNLEECLNTIQTLESDREIIFQSENLKSDFLFVWASYYHLQKEYEKSNEFLVDMVKLSFTESHFDAFTMLITNHYELDNIDEAVEISEEFLEQSKKYYAKTINEKNEKFKLFLAFNEAENEAKKQKELLNQETKYRGFIEKEKGKTDELLANLLPAKAVIELKETSRVKPKRFENASVLFSRIDGLTALSKKITPKELLIVINNCFSTFDELTEEYEIERIKTIGYSYMAISGAPVESQKHLHNLAEFAVKMHFALEELKKMGENYKGLAIRTGIQSGSIIAGVVGVKKFAYDVWGDCVNTAARMEAFGVLDKIHCTKDVFDSLQDEFSFESRGIIDIKGKGEMETYFLNFEL